MSKLSTNFRMALYKEHSALHENIRKRLLRKAYHIRRVTNLYRRFKLGQSCRWLTGIQFKLAQRYLPFSPKSVIRRLRASDDA